MLGYFINISKQFFRNWSSLFIFIFPIVILIGLGKILPAGLIISSSVTLSITTAVFFVFGPALFELRKTSMIKSMSLTTLSKPKVLVTNMLFTLVVSMISIALVLAASYLLTEVWEFLAVDFSVLIPGDLGKALRATVYWPGVNWGALVYASIMTAAVSFALIWAVVSITKTTQAMYIFMFTYIFAIVVIGGVVIPTFIYGDSWVGHLKWIFPHYYVNSMMGEAFANPIASRGFEFIYERRGVDLIIEDLQQNWPDISNALQLIADNPETYFREVENRHGETVYYLNSMGRALIGDSEFLNAALSGLWNSTTEITSVMNEYLDMGPSGIISEIEGLVEYYTLANPWSITSFETALPIFMPIVWTGALGAFGLWRYEWTVR